jgi:hypothetical protein
MVMSWRGHNPSHIKPVGRSIVYPLHGAHTGSLCFRRSRPQVRATPSSWSSWFTYSESLDCSDAEDMVPEIGSTRVKFKFKKLGTILVRVFLAEDWDEGSKHSSDDEGKDDYEDNQEDDHKDDRENETYKPPVINERDKKPGLHCVS